MEDVQALLALLIKDVERKTTLPDAIANIPKWSITWKFKAYVRVALIIASGQRKGLGIAIDAQIGRNV